MRKEFLVCYDYGTGGIWLVINAGSVKEIEEKYDRLSPFEDRPSWMSAEQKKEYMAHAKRSKMVWDVDNPSGWLDSFKKK